MSRWMKPLLILVGVAAVLVAALALTGNLGQSDAEKYAAATPQIPVVGAPSDLSPEVLAALPRDVNVRTVELMRDREDVTVIDVRRPDEFVGGHIPGAVLIPLDQLPQRLNEVPTDGPVVLACRSGRRSNQATQFLQDAGYDNVHQMPGGMLAWVKAGLPTER